MIKRLISILVVFAASTVWAQAQLLEIGAQLIGGYLLNKEIARSERKEFGSAKIVFNVYYVGDGERRLVNIWDPSTGTAVALNDDVELVPVLGINESQSPREVDWAISSEQGPLVKQLRNPVSGGKTGGSDGQFRNNGGYKHAPFALRLRDLPQGVIFVHASWGKGKTATAQLAHLDVAATYAVFSDPQNEQLRRAFAGSGHSTYPVLPVVTAVIDGQVRNFASQQELEAFVAELGKTEAQSNRAGALGNPPRSDPGAVPPDRQIQTGTNKTVGNDLQDGKNEANRPVESIFAIRAGRYHRDLLTGSSRAEIDQAKQKLAVDLSKQPVLGAEVSSLDIPQGFGLALLALSYEEFSVILETPGFDPKELKPIWVEQDRVYAWFAPLSFSGSATAESTITFVSKSGERRTFKVKQK